MSAAPTTTSPRLRKRWSRLSQQHEPVLHFTTENGSQNGCESQAGFARALRLCNPGNLKAAHLNPRTSNIKRNQTSAENILTLPIGPHDLALTCFWAVVSFTTIALHRAIETLVQNRTSSDMFDIDSHMASTLLDQYRINPALGGA
jgi:hypothetical protein